MPPLFPTNEFPNIGPYMTGEQKVFKGTVLCGIGVSDPSHINDLTKPRSATNELAVEVLRRILAPHGWKVKTVYFDSRVTYHLDCLISLLEEGLMAYPKGSLWTELPEEYRDWEVIDVSMEDHHLGAENNVVLGDKRIVVVEGLTKFKKDLEDRGWRVIEVPYSTIWWAFHSGVLCSTMAFWRES
jgi:N-dimethylarginine dimethylaminohydrolase